MSTGSATPGQPGIRKAVAVLACAGIAFAVTGCASSRSSAGDAAAAALVGTRWVLNSVGVGPESATEIPPRYQAWIEFIGDHQIGANDPAEGLDGRYDISASTLTVSNVAGTLGGTSSRRLDPIVVKIVSGMRSMFGIPGAPRRAQSRFAISASELTVTTDAYTLAFTADGPVPPGDTAPASLTTPPPGTSS